MGDYYGNSGFSKAPLLEYVKGNIEGHSFVEIVGNNPDVLIDNGEETVWDQGGKYTYLTADTQLYISSTNASDTGILVIATGVDENGAEVARTATLNGQSQVALSGDMYRVFICLVFGSTTPAGDVYIAESDTLTGGVPDAAAKIKAKIRQGNNLSQALLYTTPAGFTAFVHRTRIMVGKDKDISTFINYKPTGFPFLQFAPFEVYQQNEQYLIKFTPALNNAKVSICLEWCE